MIKFAAALLPLLVAAAATAEPLRFSSGEQRVSLVELYTSEGCSSCPPADRWLSGLRDNRNLWTTIVPVAFHVDYWDYIGWTDRFAKPEFSARQRRYADQGSASTVYTPGLFLNGQEWRGWYSGQQATSTSGSAIGELHIELDGSALRATFEHFNETPEQMQLHVAVLGMGIETDVKAGENNGKQLKHDFVVLHHQSVRMSDGMNSDRSATLDLGSRPDNVTGLAIAAWVSSAKSQVPVQATGGLLGDWGSERDAKPEASR